MKIRIEAFGIAKDIFGGKFLELELQKDTNVGMLRNELIARYPDLQDLRSLAIAVNETYANDTDVIKESDTIVVIPPVSGG